MKKFSLLAGVALATLFVGCSGEKPQTMLDQARATMPKDANVVLVTYQKPNVDAAAMQAAWGDSSVDPAQVAEMVKSTLPPVAVKVIDALGIKYDQKTMIQGEAVVALGVTLKNIAASPKEAVAGIGACVNTGAVDYPALVNIVKTEIPNATEKVSEEGEWIVVSEDDAKIGMKQLGTGVQMYAAPKVTSFATIETLGADAVIDRAFTPVADTYLTLCAKDVNTLAKQTGITADPKAALLAEVTTICATIAADVEKLNLTIEVGATTAEAAKQVEETVMGFRAMGTMMLPMAAAGTDIPAIMETVRNISITAAEAKVVITASVTPDQMKKINAEVEAMQNAKMQQYNSFETPAF